jgi:eukaryotic-like serine/threonine-protein kinase
MPDGRSVLYASSREGAQAIFRQAADGTGEPKRVAAGAAGEGMPISVSPDGRHLIVRRSSGLAVLTLDEGTASTLSQGGGNELNADISPDGRWLALDSNVSGRAEIYVRPFPRVNEGRWQVSTSGGSMPVWARSGKELFYQDQTGGIVAVPVESASTFSSGVPHRLFDARNLIIGTTTSRSWDVAPDGRFLMIRDAADQPDAEVPAMTVVLNWTKELKAKLPTQPR